MKFKQIPRRLFRLMVILITTCGFAYQAYLVCEEHFRYPTITLVSIVDVQPRILPPRLAVCFEETTSLFGQSIGQLFRERYNDETSVTFSSLMDPESNIDFRREAEDGTFIMLEKFFINNLYCLGLRPTVTPGQARPLVIFRNGIFRQPHHSLYGVGLDTNITQIFFNTSDTSANLLVYMTAYDSDCEGLLRSPLFLLVNNTRKEFVAALTYFHTISELAKPPYDTKCLQYSKMYRFTDSSLTSSQNCMGNCLYEWTEKHGLILPNYVIERHRFLNSNLSLAPWFYDADWTNEEFLSKMEMKVKGDKRFTEKISKILPQFKEHRKHCNNTCHRPDCHTERVIPQRIASLSREDPGPQRKMFIKVYPTNQPIVIVTSTAKLSLIDFVVYILSCLSFWFGFCPLNVAKSRRVTGEKPSKEDVELRERLEKLEELVTNLPLKKTKRREPESLPRVSI